MEMIILNFSEIMGDTKCNDTKEWDKISGDTWL